MTEPVTAMADDHQLDLSGLICPEPVMMLRKKLREINSGDVIYVIATDPSTVRDIPKFCHFLAHELLAHTELEQHFIYRVRKA